MISIINFKKKYIIINFLLLIIFYIYNGLQKKEIIKIALCTMGKKENLYAKEFIDYYMKLGVDHMFIYDNNEPFTEKIEDVLDNKYKNKITIYKTHNLNISHQTQSFTNCYRNNLKKYDWFIMVDMDEYLFIINDTLKNYLMNEKFHKCDFIKIHWADTRDNNLLYYDPRPLFERFKKPYIKSIYIKSIIRGNIPNLTYWVHSPKISPIKNITCTNEGNIINYTNINFEKIYNINTNKAYIIHFTHKSTEEFINKFRRGYSYWFGKNINRFLLGKVANYLGESGITLDKINYLEKELKLNLSLFRSKIYFNNINKTLFIFFPNQ